MFPVRKGLAYVKYTTEEAAKRCWNALKRGLEVPKNSTEFLMMYCEKSSKELVEPGFPRHHRDGVWAGENGKYAKPLDCKWGSTNFGEFSQNMLQERKELYSGSSNFDWPKQVTESLWCKALEEERRSNAAM